MNEFERYPPLATWMERLANSTIEGMSLGEWSRFCDAVNSALTSASNEELIRGMTEMAERYTAAMDKASATIGLYQGGVEQMLSHEQAGGVGWWKGWDMLKAAHEKEVM